MVNQKEYEAALAELDQVAKLANDPAVVLTRAGEVKADFATAGQMREAVKRLILLNPELGSVLLQVAPKYSQLHQAELVLSLTPTPISVPDGAPMVLVPAGTFEMSSNNGNPDERPVHTVTLAAFYIDQHEVTNRQFAQCVSKGVCKPPKSPQSYSHQSYYGESYAHIQEVQSRMIWLLGLSVPFTLVAAGLGGWFLAGRALTSIDRITRAAQQISADDLHQRLNLNLPNDEVGRLAVTFDQMLARLEDAFERQKRFIADASHELRTPLTILKGDVEVALNRPQAAAEYQETLEMVNQTTDRLTSLVEELFLLARADNQQIPLQFESFDLAELLRQQVAALLPRAIRQNINLNLDTPDSLLLVADPAKLTRLFLNLIDNALKYSHSGDTVGVTAVAHNGQARIAITDTGSGITPNICRICLNDFTG